MASPAALKPSICPQRQRLAEVFQQACRTIVDLHNAEIDVLVKGGHLERSELALNQARQNREAAKKALLRHVEMHRCS